MKGERSINCIPFRYAGIMHDYDKDAKEARRLERRSKGFCGYDWMIRSIIKHGDIRYERGMRNNGN